MYAKRKKTEFQENKWAEEGAFNKVFDTYH